MGGTRATSHLGEAGEPDLHEGDATVDQQGYLTDLLSDRAVGCVRDAVRRDRSFFLSLHPPRRVGPGRLSDEAGLRASELKVTARHLSHDGGSPRLYADMVMTMDHGTDECSLR